MKLSHLCYSNEDMYLDTDIEACKGMFADLFASYLINNKLCTNQVASHNTEIQKEEPDMCVLFKRNYNNVSLQEIR